METYMSHTQSPSDLRGGAAHCGQAAASAKRGLSHTEAQLRLQQYGPNQLTLKKKKNWLIEFGKEFADLMVIILIVATIISFIAGETKDGSVIAFIVVLNACIGFAQKYKAERAIEALKTMLAPTARVMRDGVQHQIPAHEVVPGDILVINDGDRIAADAQLIECYEMATQEAALTGESTPVSKNKTDTIYMGTTVTSGTGKALVIATGMMTSFGKIATLTTATEKDRTPMQKEFDHIGIMVGKITLGIVAVLLGIQTFGQHQPFIQALLFSASVAVAAVPEGLPTTITIALAIGVQRLSKKNAIVKQLSSVETLGSTTVIVTDKTGTLTKNEMTAQAIVTENWNAHVSGSGYDPQGSIEITRNGNGTHDDEMLNLIATICRTCNNAQLTHDETTQRWSIIGDPTEGALLTLAEKIQQNQDANVAQVTQTAQATQAEILYELPFDARRKRMTVIARINNRIFALTKGAPDSIINICDNILIRGTDKDKKPLTHNEITALHHENELLGNQALRVMALAYRELSEEEANIARQRPSIQTTETNLTFVALIGIIDPPRVEVPQAIIRARSAGIKIYIVTGDHGVTARAIAEKIGLATKSDHKIEIITGTELIAISDNDLRTLLKDRQREIIFARVTPEDKLRIVSLLKENGEIVAVTGDGVNDAPALKRADIGIAMGITGTDVSKEAANMILADDSFSTIITAIEEGRTIYENLKKFIFYIFSSNVGELVVIFTALAIGIETPLTAIMILLVNLGTDILPALALGIEPAQEHYMYKGPRNPTARIMQGAFIQRMVFIGLLVGVSSLAAYFIGQRMFDHITAMTMTFATLVMAQLWNALNSRSRRTSVIHNFFGNGYLIAAIIISAGIVVAATEIPILQTYLETAHLTGLQWGIVLALSTVTLIGEELRKTAMRIMYATAHA